jgi:hypothetical protein
MDQIKGDLGTAYDIFNKISMQKTTDPTDFDGCVAANYLARAYMITHDWDKALTYAQVIVDNFPVLKGENRKMTSCLHNLRFLMRRIDFTTYMNMQKYAKKGERQNN